MIDPKNITDYHLNTYELEEHMLFWVCAAGKNGQTAANCLSKFDTLVRSFINHDMFSGKMLVWNGTYVNVDTPSLFTLIRSVKHSQLPFVMRNAGIGCYKSKANTFIQLAYSELNLKTCSVDELESIKGIGPKTARCFLIHSRPEQRFAGLDVHILKFMRDKGYNVPKSTPTGKKYKQIEQWFLKEADQANRDVAEFDLEIWNEYRNKK